MVWVLLKLLEIEINLKGIMECKCIFFDCIKMDNDDVKKKFWIKWIWLVNKVELVLWFRVIRKLFVSIGDYYI